MHSEETKRKISEARKAFCRDNPNAVPRGKHHPMYGKKRPEDWRREHSMKMTGQNNPMYGKKRIHSEQTIRQIKEALRGPNSPCWKKDNNVTRNHLHKRIKNILPAPDKCPKCKRKVKLQLCNISPTYNPETYNMNIKNWHYQCHMCHAEGDGRTERLKTSYKRRAMYLEEQDKK